jgi:hypothetical protein
LITWSLDSSKASTAVFVSCLTSRAFCSLFADGYRISIASRIFKGSLFKRYIYARTKKNQIKRRFVNNDWGVYSFFDDKSHESFTCEKSSDYLCQTSELQAISSENEYSKIVDLVAWCKEPEKCVKAQKPTRINCLKLQCLLWFHDFTGETQKKITCTYTWDES